MVAADGSASMNQRHGFVEQGPRICASRGLFCEMTPEPPCAGNALDQIQQGAKQVGRFAPLGDAFFKVGHVVLHQGEGI